MNRIRIAVIIGALALTGVASAHGGLDTMKPAELEKLQRLLVREGYLKATDVTYGVYAYESEEAFDRWDEVRIKKNMQKQLEEMQAERAAETEAPAPTPEELSWWKKIVRFFKNLF